MAERPVPSEWSAGDGWADDINVEEVENVLQVLAKLKTQVTNPLIQECLKAASIDIAHLTIAAEDEEEDFEDLYLGSDSEEDLDDLDGPEDFDDDDDEEDLDFAE